MPNYSQVPPASSKAQSQDFKDMDILSTSKIKMESQNSEFCLSILIFKVQRTSTSFKSSFGALEDAGGSWLGFGILILIGIWSLIFDITMFQILALYVDFEGAKNIHVL